MGVWESQSKLLKWGEEKQSLGTKGVSSHVVEFYTGSAWCYRFHSRGQQFPAFSTVKGSPK
jgi:hypothetical protein